MKAALVAIALILTILGQVDAKNKSNLRCTLKNLDKLYERKEYRQLLHQVKYMEGKGHYRSGRFIPKYQKNPHLYSVKFKATYQLLLTECNVAEKKRLLKLLMQNYEHLSAIDKGQKYWVADSTIYQAFKQYLIEQSNEDYAHNVIPLAELYVKFIAKNWHDTIPVYRELYMPTSPSLTLKHGRDYATVDSFASAPIKFPVQSTKQLAKYLTQNLPNDYLKVRAIYTYLSTQISYDYESLNSGLFINISKDSQNRKGEDAFVHSILKRKKGVCSDFAWVFKKMCEYTVNLPTGIIHGYAKGSGWNNNYINGPSNHAWNYVVIERDTFLIEATWASCLNEREFYFLADPAKLIYTHLPEDSAFQLLSRPVSKQEFITLPDVYPSYFVQNSKRSYLDELNPRSKKGKPSADEAGVVVAKRQNLNYNQVLH